MLRQVTAVILSVIGRPVLAHDGHGATTGILHWMIEPAHALPILLAILGGLAMARCLQAYRRR